MLYNSKTDYPFWLRDCVTENTELGGEVKDV